MFESLLALILQPRACGARARDAVEREIPKTGQAMFGNFRDSCKVAFRIRGTVNSALRFHARSICSLSPNEKFRCRMAASPVRKEMIEANRCWASQATMVARWK